MRRPFHRPLPWVAVAATAVLLAYVGVGLLVPTSRGTEVCLGCGDVRTYRTFTLPFTDHVIRRTSAVRPSPVGLVLAKHGLRQGGPHRFELVQETGTSPFGGRSCGLGSGQNVFSAVQLTYVAAFLDAVLTYGDAATADRWLDRVLTEGTATNARFAIAVADAPPGGFADRAAFQAWWRTVEEYAP